MTLRRVLVGLLRVVVGLLLVVVSLVLHLPTSVGRHALRDVAKLVLPAVVPGRLTVGSVDRLWLDEIRLSRVSYADDRGAALLDGATVRVRPASRLFAALLRGQPFPAVEVHAERAWARVPYFTPSPPPSANSGSGGTPTRLPSISVTVDRVIGAIPGVELSAHDLRVEGGITAGATTTLDLRHLSIVANAMGLEREHLEGRARVVTGPSLSVDAALTLRGPSLNCDVSARSLDARRFSVQTRDCALTASALDRLAGRADRPLGLAVRVDELSAETLASGAWQLRLAAHVNEQPLELAGTVSGAAQTVDLTVHGLSLSSVVATAPQTSLEGVIHAERTTDGDSQHFVLDTTRLVAAVSGVPVPSVHAAVGLRGDILTVEELRSPDIGLSAHGTVDIARGTSAFRADATLETQALERYPWVAGRASGAANVALSVVGEGDTIRASVQASARRLRVREQGVSVSAANVRAGATVRQGNVAIDATVDARTLRVRNVLGPADVSVHATGDPRGRLHARVSGRGEGLLAALGPTPPDAHGPTSVSADLDLDLTHPDRLRVRVARSTLNLRGVRASVSGDLTLPGGASGALPSGTVDIDTDGHGSVSVELGHDRVAATMHSFDVSWLRPLVPSLPAIEGIIDGSVRLDPRNLRGASTSLRIARGRVAPLGAFEAQIDITPTGGATTVRGVVSTERGRTATSPGARVAFEVHATPPRRMGDARAWLAGVQGGHLGLENIDLAGWNDVLPPGVGAQGRVGATMDLARPATRGPLHVEVRVEGRELTGGMRVGGRMMPAVVPLALRGLACADVQELALDGTPLALRVAVGPLRRGAPEPAPSTCAPSEPLLARPLVAFDGSTRGPWWSGVQGVMHDLGTPSRTFSADTQARLRASIVDARLHVGPVTRAEWPLRAVPVRGPDGTPQFLRPPDVPPDTQVDAEVRAQGALLGIGIDGEAEVRTSSLEPVGLSEPVVARAFVQARPREPGGSLLGPVQLTVNGAVEISPDAPPAQRGEIAIDVRGSADGRDVARDGLDALTVERFDVDTRSILLERFAWARERGVRGALALSFLRTNDPQSPITARASISGLRARIGEGVEDRRETAPVQVGMQAVVVAEDHRWALHTCIEATPSGGAPSCDPRVDAPPEGDRNLRAVLSLPISGTLTAPDPLVEQATLALYARSFRIEVLTPLIRDDNIAGVGGALTAAIHWNAAAPQALRGSLSLVDGRADVITLGEPLRNLEVAMVTDGTQARIDRLTFALGRGRANITGAADLSGLRTMNTPNPDREAVVVGVQLRANAQTVPVGVEGNTYGWLDGDLRFGMQFRRSGAHGDLVVERAALLMKEEQSREVQPLGVDPDVFILGRTLLDTARPSAAYPMSLDIHLPTPVWLRRSDFAIALRGDVSARRDRGGWGVGGNIEQGSSQCWFSVLGKRFELDRLHVTLDGNVVINPQLDVAAHLDSVSAGRLTATVGGRLRSPTMDFASVQDPGASQADVLAMIALGRRDSQAATGSGDLGEQAGAAFASLVTALTLGTLTSSLTRELSFLPTLIVEPGQGSASGRYGAGVALGPRFYLQATYGAASSAFGQSSGAAQVLRVLLEFAISQSWSTSAFGAFGRTNDATTTSWGADVFFTP